MSEENVEIMQRFFDLLGRGDFDAGLETIDPDVAWDISTHPLPDVPNRGQGREAFVKEFFGTYLSGWNDYSVEVKEIFEAGDDDVLVVLHETATMPDSGARLDRDLVQLWTIRDGRGAFVRVFKTKGEALEAAKTLSD